MTTSAPSKLLEEQHPKSWGVDEYSLSVVERDGFKFVQIRFLLDDGTTSVPFDFAPAYAHALSDELCRQSANAAKK